MNQKPEQPKSSAFGTFIRGFWELPKERPSLVLSFLRGAILAAALSLVFPVASIYELLIWCVMAGALWALVDYLAWLYYAKKRGA